MPWDRTEQGGFTSGEPWLPLSPQNHARAVAVQEADAASLLHFTRKLLALRRETPALRTGDLVECKTQGTLLSFARIGGGERVDCLFNLGSAAVALPQPAGGEVLLSVNGADHRTLPGHGALWVIEA